MIIIENEKYLTPKEAASFLSISPATLWRWVEQGKISKKKITSKKVFFKESDLKNLFN